MQNEFLSFDEVQLTESITGKDFNIRSSKQKQILLYQVMGLEPMVMSDKTGEPSTSADALENYADIPLVSKLLDMNSLSTLISNFYEGIPKYIGADGRLHTEYMINGTTTGGRISSKHPNLMNLPREDKDFKKIIIAEPGYIISSNDYSQIELRILAHYSGEESLIEAYHYNDDAHDVHLMTARKMFGNHVQKKDPERNIGKTLNFSIVYGTTAIGMAYKMGIKVQEAQAFLDLWFQAFPKVAEWIERTKKEILKEKMAYSLFGRRRLFDKLAKPGISNSERNALLREGVNYRIQSTAGEIALIALAKLKHMRPILTVHDDDVFEIRKDSNLVDNLYEIKNTMEKLKLPFRLKIPLVVETKIGYSWGEAIKVAL